MNVHLVTRCRVPPPSTWVKGETLLNTLEVYYMGSAEFEFGSIPRAIARFIDSTEPKIYGSIKLTHGDEQFVVRYLVRESQEDSLKELVLDWDKKSRDFKEPVPFTYKSIFTETQREIKQKKKELEELFYIGIDKGSEFFLWRSKFGKRLIRDTICQSAKTLKKNPNFSNLLINSIETEDPDVLLRVVKNTQELV